jgi:hypothetical protein
MKKLLLTLSASLFLFACSHNPNKAEKLDTTLDKKGDVSQGGAIGLKDGNMVYQKKYEISEELRDLEIKTHEMESQVYGGRRYFDNRGQWGALKDCREKISLMGDGKMSWTEPREYVIPDEDNYSIGLDEKNNLIGVTEEFLKDRMARFRKYRDTLEKRSDEYTERINECKMELQTKQRAAESKSSAGN